MQINLVCFTKEIFMKFPVEKIEAMIYTIRGQRVMLDSDLAKLYGVETKRLNGTSTKKPRSISYRFYVSTHF